MPPSQTGSRHHEAYKWFIDELVELSRVDISAKRVRMHGHPERVNDGSLPLNETEVRRKEFFQGLTADQAEMLAEMFDESRRSAVHDIAAFLEWALSCDEITMEREGKPIPSSPYNTMHGDFVCRFHGDPWPDEDDLNPPPLLQ